MKKTLLIVAMGMIFLNGCCSDTEQVKNITYQKNSAFIYPDAYKYSNDSQYQQLFSSETENNRKYAKAMCNSGVADCYESGNKDLDRDSPAHYILENEPYYEDWNKYFSLFIEECNKGEAKACLIVDEFIWEYDWHGFWTRDFLNYFFNEDLSENKIRNSKFEYYVNKACRLDPNILPRCKN